MSFPCQKCETDQFCLDMQRCLAATMFDYFGEADAEDGPVELTADGQKGLKVVVVDGEVFEKNLNKDEVEIIKAALK